MMKQVEAQTNHRIEIEKIVITGQKNQAFRGQFFGLIIALSGIALGTYAAMNGHDGFGGVLVGGTLVSLVYVFVVGKEKTSDDLSAKRDQMDKPRQHPDNTQEHTRRLSKSERKKLRAKTI